VETPRLYLRLDASRGMSNNRVSRKRGIPRRLLSKPETGSENVATTRCNLFVRSIAWREASSLRSSLSDIPSRTPRLIQVAARNGEREARGRGRRGGGEKFFSQSRVSRWGGGGTGGAGCRGAACRPEFSISGFALASWKVFRKFPGR